MRGLVKGECVNGHNAAPETPLEPTEPDIRSIGCMRASMCGEAAADQQPNSEHEASLRATESESFPGDLLALA